MGQNTKYFKCIKPHLKEIEELVRAGYTEKSIGLKFGVTEPTFNKYKKKYPELQNAIDNGRAKIVDLVMSSLLKLALGFEEVETKEVNGEIVTITRQVRPNLKAIQMIMRNFNIDWMDISKIELDLKKRELKLKEDMMKDKLMDWGGDE